MTSRIDAERILDAYLAPGADRLPDRVIDAALSDIAQTPQRRALRVPWRFPTMNSYAKLAIAAVVVVVVAIGGFALLRPGGSSAVGAAPTATPSPTSSASAALTRSPAASPSPIDTSGWVPFTSDRYGYTISYPPTLPGIPPCTVSAPTVVGQALRDFRFGTDHWGTLPESTLTPLDSLVIGAQNCEIVFNGFAETIPGGTSVDDVISQSVGTEDPLGVPFPTCESEPITIDGQPGRFDVCGDNVSLAVVIVGDRAYVFIQGRGSVAKDLMLAQLSTVQLPTP